MALFQYRPYQAAAINNIALEWKKGHKRVLLVSPTGSGKTEMARGVIEKTIANGKKVRILAHRRNLVVQIAQRMQSLGVRYCIEMANLPNEPWVREDRNPQLYIASKDTIISRYNGRWGDLDQVDLDCFDECHRVDEETYSVLAQKSPAKYRIGLTATPIRPDGSGLGKKNWDTMVQAATVKELTDMGHLCPLMTFIPPGVSRRRKSGDQTTGIAGDPVFHWKTYAQGQRTIAFLRGVDEANDVAAQFNDAGIPAAVLSANSTNEERDEVLGKVRDGKILWLGNVNLFVEGADLPALVCCQLLRRFSSLQGFIQAVGRVLRPCPAIGKTHGILIDHAAAIAEHLYPNVEYEWMLEESPLENRERVKRVREEALAKTVHCQNCGAMFGGQPKCPYCGAALPRPKKRKKPRIERELLVAAECNAGSEKRKLAQTIWESTLRASLRLGHKLSQASVIFCRRTGLYPEQAGVTPVFPWSERQKLVEELWDPNSQSQV